MIFAVALLLFGPRKLPEIGRTIGKALGEFRRASNDLQRSLEEEVAADELRQARREINDAVGGVGRQLQDSLTSLPTAGAPVGGPGPGHEYGGPAVEEAAPGSPETESAQGDLHTAPAAGNPETDAAQGKEEAEVEPAPKDRPSGGDPHAS